LWLVTANGIVRAKVAQAYDTLTDMLRTRAQQQSDETATLHVRKDGSVVETSWASWYRRSQVVAAGLMALGVEPGDRVAVMARTRVEWLWVDQGILLAQAVTVPIFYTELATACRTLAEDAQPRVVVVDSPLQLRKWLPQMDTLSAAGVERLVVMDAEAVDAEGARVRLSDVVDADDPRVLSLATLQARGEAFLASHGAELERRAGAIGRDDVATITYTPGTEGEPKGVMLTHGNFLAASAGLLDALDLTSDDRQLLYLPLAHAFGRISVVCSVAAGVPIAIARGYRRVLEDARLLEPTFFCSIPRLFEKVMAEFEAEEEAATVVHRAVARWALDRDGGLLDGLKSAVARRIVDSRLRQVFGGRLRFAISGAAALSQQVGSWFEERGVPILEGYGMTETAAVTHLNRLDDNQYGTVGRALAGVEVRLAADGELLLRGGQISTGYWNRDASVSRLDADGWLHTGDLGVIDDAGHLSITDRKRDIILTATGKVVTPGPISEALRAHPLIGQVLVHGERRSFLSALLTLEREALERFARDVGLDLNYEELVRHPRVFATVEALVDRVNATLPPHENIRKFAILATELTPEGGDLTPTQGVRRRVAAEKHKALLDSFYSESY